MPALIAYFICLGVFLSGGYLGLNFLAGNFEEPRLTVATRSNAGHRAKEKHQAETTRLQVTSAEMTDASLNAQLGQLLATSRNDINNSETALIDPIKAVSTAEIDNQSSKINPVVIDATPSGEIVSVGRKNDSDQTTTADQLEVQVPSGSAFGELKSSANPAVSILPKAKTTQTVTNAGLEFKPTTATSTLSVRHNSVHAVKKTRPNKPGLVRMVLQTIEFPDGRREQRLISQRQAGLAK